MRWFRQSSFGKYTEKYFDGNIQSFLIKRLFKKLDYSVRKNYYLPGRSGEVYEFKFLLYSKKRKILYDPLVYPEDAFLNIIKYLDIYAQNKSYIYFCSLPDVGWVLSKYRSEVGVFKNIAYDMQEYMKAFQTVSKILQNFGIHVLPLDRIFLQEINNSNSINKFRTLLDENLSISCDDLVLNVFQPLTINKRVRIDDLYISAFESCQIALSKGYSITDIDVSKHCYCDIEAMFNVLDTTIAKLEEKGLITKSVNVEITKKGIDRLNLTSEPKKATLNDLRQGIIRYTPKVVDLIYKVSKIIQTVKDLFDYH